MSDQVHDWTDDRIDELSEKMQKQYQEAAKEMQAKLDAWLEDYDRRRKVWEDDVSSGRRTQDEYDAWLKGRAFDKSWQQEMIDTLSYDAVNADRLAMDAINDELPRIYAENANFTAYTIDKGIGMNTGFTLVDQDTVRRLMMDNPDLVPAYRIDQPKDYVWNQQKFNSAITQGILQGESIPAISKRVESVIGMDKRAATRSARTACTAAESMGRQSSYKRAQDLGIGLKQQWLATLDLRTRYTHRLLDKQTVPVGHKFCPKGYGEKHALRFPADPQGLAEEVFNCFIGETLVAADSPIERSYQHEYSGDLVTIDTASGVHFTCTPNHPILTPRGWVAAKCLNNGDDLLVTGRTNENALSWWNPDVNHRFTSMETVHELLYMLTRKRTRKLGVNFHGDIATSDVEVVAKESFLRFCLNAVRNKSIIEILLKRADASNFCESTHMKGLRGVMSSASRIMGGFGVLAAFLWGHGSHPDVHGFRTASSLDTSLAEYAIDNLPAETVIRGELLSGLSRQVFTDKIVGIKVSSTFGTHVYNLQTGNGYYFINESNNGNFIIAKNCRCTTIAVLDDEDYEDDERWSRFPDGMTYEEWKGENKPSTSNTSVNAYRFVNTSNPVWSQLGSVKVEDIASKVDSMLAGSNGIAAKLWQKYEDRIRMVNPSHSKGAFYRHADKGVHMNIQRSLDDADGRGALSTWFHEFGHNIDYLAGNGQKALTTFYGSGKFAETLKQEVEGYIKARQTELNKMLRRRDLKGLLDAGAIKTNQPWRVDFYHETLEHIADTKYLEEQGWNSKFLRMTPQERSERIWEDALRDIRISGKSIPIQNVRDVVGDEITKGGQSTQIALGDIFEGATKGSCRDTYGHGKKYWQPTYWNADGDALAKEAFAEFFSAECIYSERPEILKTMIERLPKSYEVYKEIVSVMTNA